VFSIDKPSFQLLEKALDVSNLRQKVIANNIANADTPYFKSSEVSFENLLQQQMGTGAQLQGFRTDPRHFYIGAVPVSQIEPQIIANPDTSMNNNSNNVDIDAEMANMAENQLSYNVEIQQVSHDIKQMRNAINGGGN